MKEKETKTPATVKVKVAEKDFNFLKKVNGIRDEIIIKRSKVKEKSKGENKGNEVEYDVNTVVVMDDVDSYMVQTTQLTPMFTGDNFGLKNIKAFLKAVSTYGEMEEHEDNIIFSTDKKKMTYRKLDAATITGVKSLPVIDTAGYVSIQLTKEEIKSVQEGLKNDLSDYASLRITPDNKLILKIGELSYDNIYEQEVKEITRKDVKDKSEIKFLSKLNYLKRLFENVDDDSKASLFLKAGSPLIFVEKSAQTHTKTFIAPAMDEEDSEDEEKVNKIIEGNKDE